MTFFKVLLLILLVLWLVSLVRVGVRVQFGEEGLFVSVLAGPLKLQLLPAKPKKEKAKKEKGKKEAAPKKEGKPGKKKPKEKKPKQFVQPDTLPRLMQLLPVVGQACGALKRKIRIDNLELQLIWGSSDPAAAALGYGRANAVLGMIWPMFANNFKVKRHSFEIGMDYGRTRPAVELQAAATFTVGQVVILSVHYGVKALFTWIKSGRSAVKRQEALSHE